MPIVRYCDIQGGFKNYTGSMDKTPLLNQNPRLGKDGKWDTVDDAYGNLLPVNITPVINAGLNADSTRQIDLAGTPRTIKGTVDLGAYEVQNSNFPVLMPLFFR